MLNAADYGVPQTRRRLFIVARRDRHPWRWTMATHTKDPDLFAHRRWVSMNDVVLLCVKQRPPDAQRLPPWIASRWWQLPQGRRDEVFVHSQLTSKSDGNRDWLHVRTFDRPAFTVTTTTVSNAGYVVHGGEYWRVRLRESAHLSCTASTGLLQSMPWPLPGSVTAKHIGNAVPPPLAQAVVEGLIDGGRR